MMSFDNQIALAGSRHVRMSEFLFSDEKLAFGNCSHERFHDSDLSISYERSMASPASNADGLDVTVLSHRKASVRVDKYWSNEMEPCLADVAVDFEPPPVAIHQTSSVIELFEGVVQTVGDIEMDVVLSAKRNQSIPDHAMSISLLFVQPQDRPLVKPGAVFYLTMFRETTGRTVRNVEEIRFRRQPDWTPAMFRKLDELTAQL